MQGSLTHFMALQEERNALFSELNPLVQEMVNDTDPYLVYLRGLLYMRIGQNTAAIESFIQSVTAQPYNWSAWSQLAQLIKSTDMVRLPPSLSWPSLSRAGPACPHGR